MTTLVTGAYGGFGAILSKALSSEPGDVVRVGREQCDVTDFPAVRSLVARLKPQLVYHLAGSFSNDYERDYAVNAHAARNLLEALRAEGVSARVVLFGSAAEYGHVEPHENPVREDRALAPVSVYGLTKALQTHIAGYFARTCGCDVVIARMFNLLAPGLSERLFPGRVERLIERFRNGEIETIDVGNLAASRDYVGPDDAVTQVRAITSRGEAGGVYHVASGEPVVMRDLLHRMLDAAGVPREAVREGAAPATIRPGYDVPVIFADMSRTRALERCAA